MLDLAAPWTELPLCVIDFETTGPEPNLCEPVEVGVARFERGELVDSYASLLRPSIPIPPEATAIHGITDEMVDSAPQLQDVAGDLYAIAQGAIPCAYNAPFDRTILHRYIRGIDCPLFRPDHPWFDVYVVIASPRVDKWVKGTGRLKLPAACKRHGIALKGAHRALGDSVATGTLLYRLVERGLVKPASLAKMFYWMRRRRVEQDADHAAFRARMDYTRARCESSISSSPAAAGAALTSSTGSLATPQHGEHHGS